MIDRDDNRQVGLGTARFGQSWWGKQWLRTLEELGLRYPDGRLPKARSLATNGHVDLLQVTAGELSAWVDQPRKSFEAVVRVREFTEAEWLRVYETLAAQWRNLAELREDRLPADIDRQLGHIGLTLFPTRADLTTSCPCRDRTDVCLHIIALQHAFTVWFDEDPFLLPLLRGRDRDCLLTQLRDRTAEQVVPEPAPVTRPPAAVEGFYGAGPGLYELERLTGYTFAARRLPLPRHDGDTLEIGPDRVDDGSGVVEDRDHRPLVEGGAGV
ncbi:hypothetical protein FB566_4665 [Stackebrandtia endophytica]|uniref:SWIM-type domain-containing protein n=1 Tax=Stackebrandtia endophytica TaxID=1496996 RepID=A0A543B2J5_9ACTN|nr:hypothetical protein [Stackebrandtia endophytica]TQL79064.1 hypothetical protein FB566_4665 [Stackebrandtia endophytica]